MRTNRTLALRREILTDLTEADLRGLAGADTKTTVPETLYSCMTFQSCYVPFCMIDRHTLLDCIATGP